MCDNEKSANRRRPDFTRPDSDEATQRWRRCFNSRKWREGPESLLKVRKFAWRGKKIIRPLIKMKILSTLSKNIHLNVSLIDSCCSRSISSGLLRAFFSSAWRPINKVRSFFQGRTNRVGRFSASSRGVPFTPAERCNPKRTTPTNGKAAGKPTLLRRKKMRTFNTHYSLKDTSISFK